MVYYVVCVSRALTYVYVLRGSANARASRSRSPLQAATRSPPSPPLLSPPPPPPPPPPLPRSTLLSSDATSLAGGGGARREEQEGKADAPESGKRAGHVDGNNAQELVGLGNSVHTLKALMWSNLIGENNQPEEPGACAGSGDDGLVWVGGGRAEGAGGGHVQQRPRALSAQPLSELLLHLSEQLRLQRERLRPVPDCEAPEQENVLAVSAVARLKSVKWTALKQHVVHRSSQCVFERVFMCWFCFGKVI